EGSYTASPVPAAPSNEPCTPALNRSCVSLSVKNSRFPYLAGRSIGVKLRLVQYPCRSGRPSGVRGTVQAFFVAGSFMSVSALFVIALDCVWATTNVGTHRTAVITTTRALNENQIRFLIRTSSTCLLGLTYLLDPAP